MGRSHIDGISRGKVGAGRLADCTADDAPGIACGASWPIGLSVFHLKYSRSALERLRLRQGVPGPDIGPTAVEVLTNHSWPGNVRELLNIVERLAILYAGRPIGAEEARAVLAGAKSGNRGGAQVPGSPLSV